MRKLVGKTLLIIKMYVQIVWHGFVPRIGVKPASCIVHPCNAWFRERADFDQLRCKYVKAFTKIHMCGVFIRATMLSLLKEVKLGDKIILPSSAPVGMAPPASNISSIEIISCFTVGMLYRILISSENYFLSLHTAIPLVISVAS